MDNLLTASNIIFALGVLGILFTGFLYFKDPQEDLEKKQALTDKEVSNKAVLLAQQLEWTNQNNDRRFEEITRTVQNHVHSIDTKIDILTSMVGSLNVAVGKLEVKIDERTFK